MEVAVIWTFRFSYNSCNIKDISMKKEIMKNIFEHVKVVGDVGR